MAAPVDGLSDYQRRMLEKFTIEAFNEYGNALTITELSDWILQKGEEEDNKDITNMASQLFSFTRHGPYGHFFDGKANITFSSDWSVLELDDLMDMPEMRTIALMLLITKMNRDFYLNSRKIKKLLLIDEFWKFLLEDDAGSVRIQKYIVGAFRLFRKFNASSFVCSQALTDIKDPGILQNMANMVILQQKEETIDKIEKEKTLSYGPLVMNQLRTLETKKGKYSELFIGTSGRGHGFARFIIDRFTQLVYSTDPKETTEVNMLMDEGLTLAQAINKVIETENQTASGKAA